MTNLNYSLIAFKEGVTFWFQAPYNCLMHVCLLHYLHAMLRITIMPSHMHKMQQTHVCKGVTVCIEFKKLLSNRRQSDYSTLITQSHTLFSPPQFQRLGSSVHEIIMFLPRSNLTLLYFFAGHCYIVTDLWKTYTPFRHTAKVIFSRHRLKSS